jgi:hypothetical protein
MPARLKNRHRLAFTIRLVGGAAAAAACMTTKLPLEPSLEVPPQSLGEAGFRGRFHDATEQMPPREPMNVIVSAAAVPLAPQSYWIEIDRWPPQLHALTLD